MRHPCDKEDVIRRALALESYASIAASYGVSRQNIFQICARAGIAEQIKDGRRKRSVERKEALMRPSYGVRLAERRPLIEAGITRQYRQMIDNCKARGIECTLELLDFVALTKDVPYGRGDDRLVLGRKDKSGPYSLDNLELIPRSVNTRNTRALARTGKAR